MNPLLPPITVTSSDTDLAVRGSAKQKVKADDSGPSFKEAYDKQAKVKETAKVKKTAKADTKPARETEPAAGQVREQRESKAADSTKTKEKSGAVTDTRTEKTPHTEDVRAEAQGSAESYASTEDGTPETLDEELVGPVLPETHNGNGTELSLVGDIMNSVVASGQDTGTGVEGEAVSGLGLNTSSADSAALGLAGNTEGRDALGLRGTGLIGETIPSGASAHMATQAGANAAVNASPLAGPNKSGVLSELGVGGDKLIGENLSGERLSGERLSGERLSGERLSGERLSGERLSGERLSGEKLGETGRFFSRSIEQFAARGNVTDASATADTDSGKKLNPSATTSSFMNNMLSVSQKPLSLVSKEGGLVGGTLANFADQIESSGKTQPFAQVGAGIAPGVSASGLPLAADARVQLPVSITFGQSGWANMVAERSAMMAAQSIEFAELRLDPPELGPLQVRVSVNQDQATVSFIAPNAQVKDALDQSLVRLKEMLEEQGLDLVNVDVSDQASQDADADGESQTAQSNEELAEEEEQVVTQSVEINAGYGVDHYA